MRYDPSPYRNRRIKTHVGLPPQRLGHRREHRRGEREQPIRERREALRLAGVAGRAEKARRRGHGIRVVDEEATWGVDRIGRIRGVAPPAQIELQIEVRMICGGSRLTRYE